MSGVVEKCKYVSYVITVDGKVICFIVFAVYTDELMLKHLAVEDNYIKSGKIEDLIEFLKSLTTKSRIENLIIPLDTLNTLFCQRNKPYEWDEIPEYTCEVVDKDKDVKRYWTAWGSYEGSFDEMIGSHMNNRCADNTLNNISDECNDNTLDELVIGGVSSSGKHFALITGDIDFEVRQKIVDVFNSEENKHGEIIRILLVTSTGAEGLDLKGIRVVQVMEPYWNWGRIMQILNRGARNDSHKGYPDDEKNVTPYIYLSIQNIVPSEMKKVTGDENSLYLTNRQMGPSTITIEDSTDIDLYNMSIKNKKVIESFLQSLKEVAIECLAYNRDYCRVCAPTDQPLFTSDINYDMTIDDTCKPPEIKKLLTKKINIDGVDYHYTEEDGIPKDVFMFDSKIGANVKLSTTSEEYKKVMASFGIDVKSEIDEMFKELQI
jgi:hypothetical protein